MATKEIEHRSDCPIVCSLDILGDRWTLVLLRDMLIGGLQHFSEIGRREGIATNILTDRLERLVRAGIIEQLPYDGDARRHRYLPTERGLDLIPVILELAIWGSNHTIATAFPEISGRAKVDRKGLEADIRELQARRRRGEEAPPLASDG